MTRLSEIRRCFEGAIASVVATCSPDGKPNVVNLSQVYFVDDQHVALSFQFFGKTRQNILANPHAVVLLIDPKTGAYWRLHMRYLRTDASGAVFERMKAQLAGIASHTGMQDVFKLQGADIYRVNEIEPVVGDPLPEPPVKANPLGSVRVCGERLSNCSSLEEAFNCALQILAGDLDFKHAMILMLDHATQRLYVVASSGYSSSGVGSEIEVGQGVIGVSVRENTPIRIGHMTNASSYSQAIRTTINPAAIGTDDMTEIPYPGLASPHSQLAVPIASGGLVLGALFVESQYPLRFGFEEEDAIVAIAAHLGSLARWMDAGSDSRDAHLPAAAVQATSGAPLSVRHFSANDSVFVDQKYLIKGVAGAIIWKLLNEYSAGRNEFSNRELRLDPGIGLPYLDDNLETRLILLRRRLEDFGPDLRIEKLGRGRFRLSVTRPISLLEAATA